MKTRRADWSSLLASLLLVAGAWSCESKAEADDEKSAEAVESKSDSSKRGDEKDQKAGAAKAKASGDEESSKSEDKSAPEQATVGKKAPNFTLEDAEGEEHSLKDYRGDIVVLEWTSWDCPYVKRHYQAETMSSTVDAVGGEDFTWLAIDSSRFNTPEKTKEWKKKHDIEYPILQDEEGSVGQKYGAQTTPHMYVIDKEGVLRYKGAIDDDPRGRKESPTNYVEGAVQALRAGEEVDSSTTDPYGCSVKYPK